jgi:hypothetical protein
MVFEGCRWSSSSFELRPHRTFLTQLPGYEYELIVQ